MTDLHPAETDSDMPLSRSRDGGMITISVDAMGGDMGPTAVVAGLSASARKNDSIRFLLHGDEAILKPLLDRQPNLTGRVDIRHSSSVVTMNDKPTQVIRSGRGSSMWNCIESLRDHEADAAVSCGNTGALMALSTIRLRKLPGVNRPAIACLWPSRNPQKFNVMLDCGADIRADAPDLVQYAMMGAAYARDGLELAMPRVGLLNVGTEDHKGRAELKQAHELISNAQSQGHLEYIGFVEGGDIPSDRVDVIVTDGFTGNIALKTGEGTAKLITDFLKEAFSNSILSRMAAVLALSSLKRVRKRTDPRQINGGVFLGLNGTVVKSHGSADATGISSAIKLAFKLAQSNFQDQMARRLAAQAETYAAAEASTETQTAGTDTG